MLSMNGSSTMNGGDKPADGVKLANGAAVSVEPRSTKLLERSKQKAIVKQLTKQADQQVLLPPRFFLFFLCVRERSIVHVVD